MHNIRKIFIGTSVHSCTDNRIFHKEAVSLAKHFDVELHAPADFEQKHLKNVTIFGLPQWQKESDRKAIRIELWHRLQQSNADIFIFHDPELIWIGIKAAVIQGIKVVYDMHENTVASIKRKKWLGPFSKLFAIAGYTLLQSISKRTFSHYLLAEHSYQKFIKNNATVVLNYPIVKDCSKDKDSIYDLVYLGDVTEDRGCILIIGVLNKLISDFADIKLAIIGKIEKNANELIKDKIEKFGLDKHVTLFGYIDYPEAMKIVCKSKLGLCLLKPIPNYIHSYPTKLFDYMQAGVHFVCSNFPLYIELIDECDAGVTVDPLDLNAATKEISRLLTDSNLYDKMSQNGIDALNSKFNWTSEEEKLIAVMKSILT